MSFHVYRDDSSQELSSQQSDSTTSDSSSSHAHTKRLVAKKSGLDAPRTMQVRADVNAAKSRAAQGGVKKSAKTLTLQGKDAKKGAATRRGLASRRQSKVNKNPAAAAVAGDVKSTSKPKVAFGRARFHVAPARPSATLKVVQTQPQMFQDFSKADDTDALPPNAGDSQEPEGEVGGAAKGANANPMPAPQQHRQPNAAVAKAALPAPARKKAKKRSRSPSPPHGDRSTSSSSSASSRPRSSTHASAQQQSAAAPSTGDTEEVAPAASRATKRQRVRETSKLRQPQQFVRGAAKPSRSQKRPRPDSSDSAPSSSRSSTSALAPAASSSSSSSNSRSSSSLTGSGFTRSTVGVRRTQFERRGTTSRRSRGASAAAATASSTAAPAASSRAGSRGSGVPSFMAATASSRNKAKPAPAHEHHAHVGGGGQRSFASFGKQDMTASRIVIGAGGKKTRGKKRSLGAAASSRAVSDTKASSHVGSERNVKRKTLTSVRGPSAKTHGTPSRGGRTHQPPPDDVNDSHPAAKRARRAELSTRVTEEDESGEKNTDTKFVQNLSMVSASSSSDSRSSASLMSLATSTDTSDIDADRYRASLNESFSSNATTVVDDEEADWTASSATTSDSRVSVGSSSTEAESDSSHASLQRTSSLATVETRAAESTATAQAPAGAGAVEEKRLVLRHPLPRHGERTAPFPLPPSSVLHAARPQLTTNSPTDELAPEELDPLRAVLQKRLEKEKSDQPSSENSSSSKALVGVHLSTRIRTTDRDHPSHADADGRISSSSAADAELLLPPIPVSVLPPPAAPNSLGDSSAENRLALVPRGREAGDENNDENANMNVVNRSSSAERDGGAKGDSASMALTVPENDSSFSVDTSGSALEPLPMFEHLPVPPCDVNHEWDSGFLSAYGNEIFQNCKSGEAEMLPDPRYMSFQPEISERMRTILIDWLFEVKAKFKLHSSTMFLTVNLLDRFLSTCHCSKGRLQLLGCTAMLIAAKMEEIWAPEIQDFVYVSDNTFTKEDVMEMERQVAVSVNWSFMVHTSIFFARRLLQVVNANQFESYFASYLLDLCLEEYGMLKYRPSLLASAIMFLIVRHRDLFGKHSTTVVTTCHPDESALASADQLAASQHGAAFQSPPNTLSKSESNNVIRRLRENATRLRITAMGRSQNDEESEHLWRWILALCDSVDTMHDRILGDGPPSTATSSPSRRRSHSGAGDDSDPSGFAAVAGLNLSFAASASNSVLSSRESNGENVAPASSSSSTSGRSSGGFGSRSSGRSRGSGGFDLSEEQIGAPLGIPYHALRWQRSESSGRLKARWELQDFRGVPQLGQAGPLVTDAPLRLDDSNSWPEALRAYTSYSLPELRACVTDLTALLRHRRAREQVVRTRYEHHEVMRVAHWAMHLYETPRPLSAVPARVAAAGGARR